MAHPKLLVVDLVGLTPDLLRHMPRLRRLADQGSQATLEPILPAVTCSVQSTFLTGLPPSGHGAVGNGWYFRELGEVFLWRQHNKLVDGEKVWETIRRERPDYTVANVCWWYAMGMTTDYTVTPRPIYYADGRRRPTATPARPSSTTSSSARSASSRCSPTGARPPRSPPASGSSPPPAG